MGLVSVNAVLGLGVGFLLGWWTAGAFLYCIHKANEKRKKK